MHRARVTAVGNTKAQADGKWLNIIGNKDIAAGDFVWTDGRCVYGNISEGGGAAPIINTSEPYVPIFMKDGKHCLYHKGKLKTGWQDVSHELMVSRGSEAVFSDYYRTLDVIAQPVRGSAGTHHRKICLWSRYNGIQFS